MNNSPLKNSQRSLFIIQIITFSVLLIVIIEDTITIFLSNSIPLFLLFVITTPIVFIIGVITQLCQCTGLFHNKIKTFKNPIKSDYMKNIELGLIFSALAIIFICVSNTFF